MTEGLTPFSDGCMYYNYVYEDAIKSLRGITETERQIIDYCWKHTVRNKSSEACKKLTFNDFEHEPFHSDTLQEAGRFILESLDNLSRKSKSDIAIQILLEKYINRSL